MTIRSNAVAYYRTGSVTSAGEDKASLERQKAAVSACARVRGLQLVGEYSDGTVSGADPVDGRPGFCDMLARLLSNGVCTIIVESASRFARDLIAQQTGYQMLRARGIELIATDSPDSFLSDTTTAIMIRQILGVVAQFDKATLVQRLRGARDRKSAKLGRRVEGNPNWKPVPAAAVQAARKAHGRGLSLRAIAGELAAAGFLAPSGKPYGAQSVARMMR